MKHHTKPKYKIGDIVLVDIYKLIEQESFYPSDYFNVDFGLERVVQCKITFGAFIKNGGAKGEIFRHWNYVVKLQTYASDEEVEISVSEKEIIEKI